MSERALDRLAEAFASRGMALQTDAARGDPAERLFMLSGGTFDYRAQLRRAGGQWDRSLGGWLFRGVAALDLALELIENPSAAKDPFGAAAAPSSGLAEDAGRFAGAKPDWGSKHYHGHRQRLRDKLLELGEDTLADYELIELLLFFSVQYRDTKPLAKDLLERFGGVAGLLAADPARLRECPGLDPGRAVGEKRERLQKDLAFSRALLCVTKAIADRALKERIDGAPSDAPTLDDQAARAYLGQAIGAKTREESRALFLDKRRKLMREERLAEGTIDSAPLYPRELARRALEIGAAAVIIAHNHPTGDPSPSAEDIAITRQAASALEAVGVALLDHLIVGAAHCFSFRDEGLLR